MNLLQIWTGEEFGFGFGSRLWTHGYDFYSPGPNQKQWHHNQTRFKISKKILENVLKMPGTTEIDQSNPYPYGLGQKRSIDDYAHFCGIDTRTKTVLFDTCRDYRWVPWTWNEKEIQDIREYGRGGGTGAGMERNSDGYQNNDNQNEFIFIFIFIFIGIGIALPCLWKWVGRKGDNQGGQFKKDMENQKRT